MTSISNSSRYIATVLTIAFCIGVIAGTPLWAHAQPAQALSVTPTLFEMSASPGQVWQSGVKVVNSNPYPLTVFAAAVNFSPQGETGQGKLLPVFEEVTEGATLAEWIDIDSEPVTILREESREIPFSVTVPDDASPGGHFAAILVSTQPPESISGMSVRTSQVVTSLFFVRIAGDVSESGSIRSFTVSDAFVDAPSAAFELRFENKGNVHLQPRGDIRIFNMWGKERGTIPINHQTHFGNVLPESVRKFEFSWSGERTLTDIGRYKAVASLAYGSSEKRFSTSTTYFWVIPVKPFLIILGSLLAFVLFVTWAIKLYVRRMLQLAGVPLDEAQVPSNRRKASVEIEGDIRIAAYRKLSAPMRSGYLDLRERLRNVTAATGLLHTLASFIAAYRIFFASVIVVMVGVTALVFYVLDVTDAQKSYDITIANPDQDLTLTSEEIAYEKIAEEHGLQPLGSVEQQQFVLDVVNTSGAAGTAAQAAARLAANGYAVSSITTVAGRTDTRSVVVFDPLLQEAAVALSRSLDGALLSARTGTSTEPNITVFVGKDMIKKR